VKRFVQIKQPKATWREVLIALIGGALGIGILEFITQVTNLPLLWAPFGGTCVLVFAAHSSPFSQPLNVLGGHLLSAILSFVLIAILPAGPFTLMLVVGVVIAAMRITRLTHPPAGANPIVIYLAHASWVVVLPSLAIGALAILVVGYFMHLLTKTQYPI
jgi:CBS-domain-containing membrane protein